MVSSVDTGNARDNGLVRSDEGTRFGITNVLHLVPPLLYARSADVPDVPSEGHHDVVLSRVLFAYIWPILCRLCRRLLTVPQY